MDGITWKYVKPLINENKVTEFLKMNKIEMDEDLLNMVKTYNGGRPSPDTFDTEKSSERVFKALLSYNEEDRETIYKCYSGMLKDKELFPFASDPSGNYICVDVNDHNHIVFWGLESLKKEFVANSFREFMEKMY